MFSVRWKLSSCLQFGWPSVCTWSDVSLSNSVQMCDIAGTGRLFIPAVWLQALRYLQNVCNHPKLVLSPRHPEYDKIAVQLKQQNSSMADIQHAAKLPALKYVLSLGLVLWVKWLSETEKQYINYGFLIWNNIYVMAHDWRNMVEMSRWLVFWITVYEI